ncbi:unnamed protein product [Orchesella dallaii]|uniref:Uncharacterized protein n=1 Tax=Orchesella dallaii TaxID=48710 RepID=A0ABP1RWE1_9HEXA
MVIIGMYTADHPAYGSGHWTHLFGHHSLVIKRSLTMSHVPILSRLIKPYLGKESGGVSTSASMVDMEWEQACKYADYVARYGQERRLQKFWLQYFGDEYPDWDKIVRTRTNRINPQPKKRK